MGYTHYFERKGPVPTDEEWGRIKSAAAAIATKHRDILCKESDTPDLPPVISDLKICFNGKGNDGHETFLLKRAQDGFEFCKTVRKPYDAAVVEVLKAVKKICPGWLALSSDGDYDGDYGGDGPIFG